MQIYLKTSPEGLVIESCPSPLVGVEPITVTEEEAEKMALHYDTVVVDGTITSQTKGDDALAYEAPLVTPTPE